MNEFDNQEAKGAAPPDELEEFEIAFSNLAPEKGSHFLLARLRGGRHVITSALFAHETAPETSDGKQQNALDNFEIEFSDLPPDKRSHFLLLKLTALKKRVRTALPGFRPARATAGSARPARTQRRASVGRALTALGLCAAVLLLLAGNVPSVRSRLIGFFESPVPTPAPLIADTSNLFSSSNGVSITVGHSSLVPIGPEGELGPLPSTCPKANTLQPFESPLDPPGLGGGPVWLVGFSGPTASLVHLNQGQERWLGWYQTLTLFIEKGYEGTLILQGGDQVNGTPLWFGNESMSNINNSVYLNLQRPTGNWHFLSSGQWEFMAVNVFVPAAGCYFLQANWSGGSWIADFAAGYL